MSVQQKESSPRQLDATLHRNRHGRHERPVFGWNAGGMQAFRRRFQRIGAKITIDKKLTETVTKL
jgi:hypothetical protein